MGTIFLRGMTSMGCLVAALFFFRFWQESLDRFFLFFSLAFVVLAGDYAVLGLVSLAAKWQRYVFGVRFIAFLFILLAIDAKTRD